MLFFSSKFKKSFLVNKIVKSILKHKNNVFLFRFIFQAVTRSNEDRVSSSNYSMSISKNTVSSTKKN